MVNVQWSVPCRFMFCFCCLFICNYFLLYNVLCFVYFLYILSAVLRHAALQQCQRNTHLSLDGLEPTVLLLTSSGEHQFVNVQLLSWLLRWYKINSAC